MKSPVQRLLWERKVGMLKRPAPVAAVTPAVVRTLLAGIAHSCSIIALSAGREMWIDYSHGETPRPELQARYKRYLLHVISKAFYLDAFGNIARRGQA